MSSERIECWKSRRRRNWSSVLTYSSIVVSSNETVDESHAWLCIHLFQDLFSLNTDQGAAELDPEHHQWVRRRTWVSQTCSDADLNSFTVIDGRGSLVCSSFIQQNTSRYVHSSLRALFSVPPTQRKSHYHLLEPSVFPSDSWSSLYNWILYHFSLQSWGQSAKSQWMSLNFRPFHPNLIWIYFASPLFPNSIWVTKVRSFSKQIFWKEFHVDLLSDLFCFHSNYDDAKFGQWLLEYSWRVGRQREHEERWCLGRADVRSKVDASQVEEVEGRCEDFVDML